MEKSYEEILRLLERLNIDSNGFVYKGSETYLSNTDQPVTSVAAHKIVELGLKATSEDPLYVVAIGAITNVASALLMEPKIASHIVIVWLGGHA